MVTAIPADPGEDGRYAVARPFDHLKDRAAAMRDKAGNAQFGIAAAGGAVKAASGAIPWIYTPPWLPPGMIVVSALMCGLASLMSVRKALSVEPGRVFRA